MNISQVAQLTQLSQKQIRDYEKIGLINIPRSNSKYRIFSEQEIQQLHFISNARNVGFSLKQIEQLLELHRNPNRCSREVKHLTAQHILQLKNKIRDIQKMLMLLEHWHHHCKGNEQPECYILDNLSL